MSREYIRKAYNVPALYTQRGKSSICRTQKSGACAPGETIMSKSETASGAHVPCIDLLAAWSDLETQLEAHRSDLNLSFGLEYSSVVDWVADLTPRRGHPKARQYGEVWLGRGGTAAEAITLAIRDMRDELTANATAHVREVASNVQQIVGDSNHGKES